MGSPQAAKKNVFRSPTAHLTKFQEARHGISIVEVGQGLQIDRSIHTRVSEIEDRPAFLATVS
jgi:hypothetical protein